MNVLTPTEMREVDRLTIERGISGLILMENAANRFVDFLLQNFPLKDMQVTVVCGKGNNGGDGFAIARQLQHRKLCRRLTVVALHSAEKLDGDAAVNLKMLMASRISPIENLSVSQRTDLIIDAVLGTGVRDAPREPEQSTIDTINQFDRGTIRVAVDIPSGLPFEPHVRADHTVTFTAPKPALILPPTYAACGKLSVVPVGSPPELIRSSLHLSSPADFAYLLQPRPTDSNKGLYGHVLVAGGSFGKSGAPAMCGLGSFRTGAGLVTVAVPKSALIPVAIAAPELMTEPLEETEGGWVRFAETSNLLQLLEKKTVMAVGPGLGTSFDAIGFVSQLFKDADLPGVFDADALNVLAGRMPSSGGRVRILTPHPGEMARLAGVDTQTVQRDRLGTAKKFAAEHQVTVVLKGDRTVIAFPEADGEAWINPTGSPSMATGGTGDILTGMVAGMVAQHPKEWKLAVIAAVWLHGRCGELAAEQLGERSTLALDLLTYLPAAIKEASLGHSL